MRKSFVSQPAPMLAGVVRAGTPNAAIAEIKNLALHGAQGVDLHLSCLAPEYRTPEQLKRIFDWSPLPVMALNYNQNLDWTVTETTEEERVALLIAGLEAGASGVDIQGYTFDPGCDKAFREEFSVLPYAFLKAKPRGVTLDPVAVEKQCALIDRVHEMGGEVLLSNHLFCHINAEQLLELCLYLEQRRPDLIKLVYDCDTEEELLENFRAIMLLKREVRTPVALMCNGAQAAKTRLLNPIFGSYLVFVTDGYSENSNFAQIDLTTAKSVYDGIGKYWG